MKRLSWKYIAGLIDGEGCINFQYVYQKPPYDHGRKYITPRVRICMVESCIFILENLHTNFGGELSTRHFEREEWQSASNWQIQGKKIRPFLQNIVNHLYIKKEQCKFCIWFIDNVMGKQVDPSVTQCALNELKAMKVDPHRLSEKAVLKMKELMR